MNEQFTASHRGGSGEPLVLVHGFTDTWRTWELLLPRLEGDFDVLAPTLAGHAGGPGLPESVEIDTMVASVESAMDEAGFETAHVAGNSLGGFVALQLAERGRARSVVALAPGGGWGDGAGLSDDMAEYFNQLRAMVLAAVPHLDAIVSTPEGRRMATQLIVENYEHIPPELIAHQISGVAACEAAERLVDVGRDLEWRLDPSAIDCAVRFAWGRSDRVLPWPSTAERFRSGFPDADWVILDEVGHCPQLDVPIETAELIRGFASP